MLSYDFFCNVTYIVNHLKLKFSKAVSHVAWHTSPKGIYQQEMKAQFEKAACPSDGLVNLFVNVIAFVRRPYCTKWC